MKKSLLLSFIVVSLNLTLIAQNRGITNTSASKYAKMNSTNIDAVKWTNGFWAERYNVFKDTMILSMWKTIDNPDISHMYRNFEVAAGDIDGDHWGPPFHDGDFYKWLEGVASVYAVTKDPKLDALMDKIIAVIVKVQRADGYIHTPVIIAELHKGIDSHKIDNTVVGTKVGTADKGAFNNRLNFETYNLGHLMMAGIIHKRATGKTTLFNAAVKATDFLCHFYETASAELARNAICPSHYMGVVEMYRATGNPRYLELAKNLINIRGMVENGTDDNQDRIPFRQQYQAMGHAVRANYLYAGVADVYAETGEQQLIKNLTSIWTDITTRKMYVTGACGALYDGTSPDGTNYHPDSIQKVHQAYGRAYQLPNSTAHNETCANIGNMLFNWRMLQVTADAKYADVLETALYNSVLSGVSLDGKRFFYTNPLRISNDFPYKLRWPKERTEYISCFCCPPNTVRTLCEAQDYAYSLGRNSVYCNLYGGSQLETMLNGKDKIKLTQTTDYPWDGNIKISIENAPEKAFSLYLRIPEWCDKATITVNGQPFAAENISNTYTEINRIWKKGDVVELILDMPVKLLESNPLVEETRNQTCVKRGPLVYCLEGMDIQGGKKIDDVMIPADIKFTPRKTVIAGSSIVVLDGTARLANEKSWKNTLYREVGKSDKSVNITLIPYYAWGNRGKMDMTVWMPLEK
ncbi:MAG: glycoside hydrolase family 127 protein [Paludibacter sp.]|nr:glycoside hydrolase family 127 protein [Paludibacter sp.]